MQITKNFT
jgi:zinc D-Ala-D-Ala carboxypeptidase